MATVLNRGRPSRGLAFRPQSLLSSCDSWMATAHSRGRCSLALCRLQTLACTLLRNQVCAVARLRTGMRALNLYPWRSFRRDTSTSPEVAVDPPDHVHAGSHDSDCDDSLADRSDDRVALSFPALCATHLPLITPLPIVLLLGGPTLPLRALQVALSVTVVRRSPKS